MVFWRRQICAAPTVLGHGLDASQPLRAGLACDAPSALKRNKSRVVASLGEVGGKVQARFGPGCPSIYGMTSSKTGYEIRKSKYETGRSDLPFARKQSANGRLRRSKCAEHAIIRSWLSPTAAGSARESMLARAASRGRRSGPTDRRRGRNSA